MLLLDGTLAARLTLQKRALLFAWVTVLVLFVFQPFGTYESELSYKYLRLAGYGFVTFFAVFLAGIIEIRLSAHRAKIPFYPQLIIALYIVIAALFNHSYFVVAIFNTWHLQNQLMFILYVSAIAIFPTTILYFRYRNNDELPATSPSSTKAIEPSETKEITIEPTIVEIVGENKSDILPVALHNIVLLKSADNYCEVVIKKEGAVAVSILRTSLSKILEQLPDNSGIVKCHRSFGVNLSLVESYQGNASGLKLKMQLGDTIVPVSRTYVTELKQALSFTP